MKPNQQSQNTQPSIQLPIEPPTNDNRNKALLIVAGVVVGVLLISAAGWVVYRTVFSEKTAKRVETNTTDSTPNTDTLSFPSLDSLDSQ